YLEVLTRRCAAPNCDTHPVFGKPGTKDAEFCRAHAPSKYLNVRSKRCAAPSCTKQPSYGNLGYSPTHCAAHRQPGQTLRPLKRCSGCKKPATKCSPEKEFYCEVHAPEGTKDLHDVCGVCCHKVDPGVQVCPTCDQSLKLGTTVKRHWKELAIERLLENLGLAFVHDKQVEGGCTRRRPDFRIERPWGTVILEVDEHQHDRKNYACECEVARMRQIYFDLGVEGQKLVFLRYNPDRYIPSYGKEKTTSARQEHLAKLLTMTYGESCPDARPLTVVYLFYDGFSELDPDVQFIDPYART
ncbi:MAG: hypothetical protein ACYCOU_10025, partial [Sulfobacillus sp.]